MGINLAIVTVIPSSWRVTEEFVEDFIKSILENCKKLDKLNEIFIIVSASIVGRENWQVFSQLIDEFKEVNLLLNNGDSISTSNLYLHGFERAMELNADLILEIDCSGAHNPNEIPNFIEEALNLLAVDKNTRIAVMSTRFGLGGSDAFPKSRVLISILGTQFAKTFLNLGADARKISDLTSGYECFSGSLLKDILEVHPYCQWVSYTHGPLHLFQTEVRAMVLWLGKYKKVIILQRPIQFGLDFKRKLAPLNILYLFKAFLGGLYLINEGFEVRGKLKRDSA